MSPGARTLLREDAGAAEDIVAPALPLNDSAEPLVAEVPQELPEALPLEPARALVLADFQPPRTGPVDSVVRWAYRLGVPGSVLAAPLRKPTPPRLLATVASPLEGERAAGMALRAGQFLVHGLKVPIDKVEFTSNAPLTPPVQRVVQGFTWLRDLAACAPREECAGVGEKLLARWLKANPVPARGPAWTVEHTGLRLLAWLVNAPLLLGGDARLRGRALDAMEAHARYLDRQVA
ncbi:MAG: heparinase, partial [Pseudomonadota bacterium]|nr:heparinase [Pseudomonadota bacterium]